MSKELPTLEERNQESDFKCWISFIGMGLLSVFAFIGVVVTYNYYDEWKTENEDAKMERTKHTFCDSMGYPDNYPWKEIGRNISRSNIHQNDDCDRAFQSLREAFETKN